jgi:hypothetical protein
MSFRPPTVDHRILRDGDWLRAAVWNDAVRRYHETTGQRLRAGASGGGSEADTGGSDDGGTEAPAIRIILPAREAVGEQIPDNAAALIAHAAGLGWAVAARYSMAIDAGETIELTTVRLRLRRHRGLASWRRRYGGSWSFEYAIVDWRLYGWSAGKGGKTTIREVLAQIALGS